MEVHVAPADVDGFTEAAARGGEEFHQVACAACAVVAAQFGEEGVELFGRGDGDAWLGDFAAFEVRGGVEGKRAAFTGEVEGEAECFGFFVVGGGGNGFAAVCAPFVHVGAGDARDGLGEAGGECFDSPAAAFGGAGAECGGGGFEPEFGELLEAERGKFGVAACVGGFEDFGAEFFQASAGNGFVVRLEAAANLPPVLRDDAVDDARSVAAVEVVGDAVKDLARRE